MTFGLTQTCYQHKAMLLGENCVDRWAYRLPINVGLCSVLSVPRNMKNYDWNHNYIEWFKMLDVHHFESIAHIKY